jgi:RNA polymerase sigma-70 factor (ECF subfamily)
MDKNASRWETEEHANPEAIAALYDRFYQRVYNYIRYRCDDNPTAEDLTALVFEKLLLSFDQLAERQTPVEAWVLTVARNLVNDHFRRQRFRAWLPWEALRPRAAPDPPPEDAVIEREWHAHLTQALRTLTDRERDLVGLKFASGLNNREIADLTGIRETNVGVILYRALRKLRAVLQSLEPVLPMPGMPSGEIEVSDERPET